MNNNSNLNIPLEIGDYILKNSLFKVQGFMSFQNNNKIFLENITRIEDIDIGFCGIILFLIEINKIWPSYSLKRALIEAGNDLIIHCKTTPRNHYGFYKGRAGLCFTLKRLTQILGDVKYLHYSKELIRNDSEMFLTSKYANNRLYDGRSGLLLLLLHLYNIEPEDWIITKINQCLSNIISDFIITDKGTIWNRKEKNIKPLNGFLHGSSGIVFVLIQTAILFNDKNLFSLAKSICTYEDLSWNNDEANWPDYKKEIVNSKDYQHHKNEYLNKNSKFFEIPSYTHSWADGAAGICMARLPLAKYQDGYSNQLDKSILRMNHSNIENLTLSHGISGIGTLLLESSIYLENMSHNEKLTEMISAIKRKTINFEDLSLFHGITGLGYFLAQNADPYNFESILLPKLAIKYTIKVPVSLRFNSSECLIKCFESTFPYTFITLHTINQEHYAELILNCNNNFAQDPSIFMQEYIFSLRNRITSSQYQLVNDIFILEKTKVKMLMKIKSFSKNYIKDSVKFEEKVALQNMNAKEIDRQQLVFAKETKTITAKWNWTKLHEKEAESSRIIHEFLNTEPTNIKLLLFYKSYNDITEEKLDTFGSLTKLIFSKPIMVCKAKKEYLNAFKIKNKKEKDIIINCASKYINYFIKRSLLNRQGN